MLWGALNCNPFSKSKQFWYPCVFQAQQIGTIFFLLFFKTKIEDVRRDVREGGGQCKKLSKKILSAEL